MSTPSRSESDIAVVGAGPAGLAAALAAAGFGCEVTLIDSGPAIGGQIYRQSLLGRGRGAVAPSSGPLPPRLHRAARHPRIRHLAATSVWHAEPEPDGWLRLRLAGPDRPGAAPSGKAGREAGGAVPVPDGTATGTGSAPDGTAGRAGPAPDGTAGAAGPTALRARAVVLATGAAELVLPFPGWDLPGVTTAGAAQALLKSQGVTVGRRVLVSGSGPLLLPVAAGLAEAGVRVVAVLEATAAGVGARHAVRFAAYPGKLREAAGYAATLARHRVPVRAGHAVVACHGAGRVERATIARLDRDWRPVPGSQRDEAVDAVHVGFGFSPALDLARLLGCAGTQHPARPTAAVRCDADLATSVAGVFAAGEVTGIGGAQAAELEGYLAGASAARYLGRLHPVAYTARTRTLRARLRPARRFAALLDEAYPLRPGWLDWPEPDTIACRCEETRWEEIGRAVAAGAADVRSVKGLTRCGMGYCQGRICGPIVQYAVAAAAGRPLGEVGDLHSRPLVTPVPLGVVAGEG
jgi:D-hydroxyproline dehydrogenase subunit alpha